MQTTTEPSTAVSAQALHGREYHYGTLPNSGWRFLNEGEVIARGDYTYHVSDSTYIPCVMSAGRKVDRADAGAKFIRLETEDNYREEEIADACSYAESERAAVSAHTPGEWVVTGARPKSNFDKVPRLCVVGPGHHVICELRAAAGRDPIEWDSRTLFANARLIAAAPEMLAALKESSSLLAKFDGGFGNQLHASDRDRLTKAHAANRAAIAAATAR